MSRVAMPAAADHAARITALRAEVQKIERSVAPGAAAMLPLGVAAVDARLTGGGLAAQALHDIAPATPDPADDAAATLFLAGIAARRSRSEPHRMTVLWALTRRDLFAPGLAQAGLTSDRLIHAECRSDEEVLAVMEEGLRHGSLAAIVGEVGRCPMASARRLQLAAEEGGTLALMLRRWQRAGRDPLAEPSSAVTRWRISCAPSVPLPVEGIGRACLRVELARQRGGEPHQWILEAPDAEARLALFSPSRDRPDQAEDRRAA